MKRPVRLIPNRLKKYRLLRGLEQTEVARLLGLKSHSRISEWENGTCRPTLEYLFLLSMVYRTLPDELYYDLRQELATQLRARVRTVEIERDEGS